MKKAQKRQYNFGAMKSGESITFRVRGEETMYKLRKKVNKAVWVYKHSKAVEALKRKPVFELSATKATVTVARVA